MDRIKCPDFGMGAETIMLQICFSERTRFCQHGYGTIRNVVRACVTNEDYVQGHLDNYALRYVSGVRSNSYKFLIFDRR